MYSVSRSAFTLIELLVVIAIIAILVVVVVLTLNPAQLLAQSRDANRVSDMATLNSALNLYNTDQAGASPYALGNTSNVYLSLPDTSISGYATSTCTGIGIASSTGSYADFCVSQSNYRMASSSGWIPVNFSSISSGSPLGSLPVDPVNQSSSNLYYTYATNNLQQYTLSSFMESQKYAKTMATTGGIDPVLYETGSGINTMPDLGRGLVGYWPLNEGSNNVAYDWSGNNATGTWNGVQSGTSGYYSAGKTWAWAGYFNGNNNYINIPPASLTNLPVGGTPTTITLWVNVPSVSTTTGNTMFFHYVDSGSSPGNLKAIGMLNSNSHVCFWGNTDDFCSSSLIISPASWHFIAFTYNGGTSVSLSFDGSVQQGTISLPLSGGAVTVGMIEGSGVVAVINDIRVYNRALSAAEIQQLYNAGK